ncbi:MgtC/SapB family protein [Leptolyngbya sp. KIOST-1]|uniref:MgtC/SapB family protein n=1 Tax=Leptolyngbya sp. KIOST-1 TaxID=1229172 RepID=UPI00055C2916|nr:MgtC/SapB family protein [Leptolyngbya sp. KIOST-1]
MDWLQFSFEQLLINGFKVILAFLLALPIALEREKSTRIMGLRTFPLVAVASCGYVLTAIGFIGPGGEDSKARILQGLMGGLGFIGGGAILKEGVNVRGTATAASVWSTGALGAAVAYAQYEVALLITAVNYLTLRFLTPIEEQMGKSDRPPSARSSQDEEP